MNLYASLTPQADFFFKKRTESIPSLLSFWCSAQFLKQDKFSIKDEEKRVEVRSGMGNIFFVMRYVPKLEFTNMCTVFKDSDDNLAEINNLGKQHMVSCNI